MKEQANALRRIAHKEGWVGEAAEGLSTSGLTLEQMVQGAPAAANGKAAPPRHR